MDCGQNPFFLLYNKIFVQHIHQLRKKDEELFYKFPRSSKNMPEFPTILRVEVVGLIRQVYRNADKSFQVITVDDGTACIQCTAGLSTLNQAFIQDSELPPALQKMCRRLDQRELQTGEMVRVRGVLTADTYHGCNRKRIKVTEIGIETDPNAFTHWVQQVARTLKIMRSCTARPEDSWSPAATAALPSYSPSISRDELWTLTVSLLSSNNLTTFTRDSLLELFTAAADSCAADAMRYGWNEFIEYNKTRGAIYQLTETVAASSYAVTVLYQPWIDCVRLITERPSTEPAIAQACHASSGVIIPRACLSHLLEHMEAESLLFSYLDDKGKTIYRLLGN